ncbi:unnamed protein product [Periconia digitata]|uniref:Zn(2)-C6 fungal-type domain-containing protein n=1 Tax=Periconia digitata TaxID=1303443 RepID=A0A9W4UQK7_9PLEO|nr:unnamed protein product [Periconia digitata]
MPDQLPPSPSGHPHGTPTSTVDKGRHRDKSPRPRRRNRLITSCLECRRRKLKCDKQQPCVNCLKFSRSCVFIQVDPKAQAKLAEVKEKMGILERSLEEDAALKNRKKRESRSSSYEMPILPDQDEDEESDQEDDENVKGIQENVLVVEDASYYDGDDNENDDFVDLGLAMGKMRITDRIGGLVRPRFADEIAAFLDVIPGDDSPNLYAGQSPEAWIAPGVNYVEPSSSFLLDAASDNTSLLAYLPSKALVDKILAHYWKYAHVIAQTVHRPSFYRDYATFWRNVSARFEPRPSYQALLFAMLLCSTISMSEDKVQADYGVEKSSLVNNFKQGTESALARANLLRTTKLETIQAFVTYLIPLCRSEVSRAHSALVGTCIRLAECMGMHRDPTGYSKNPIEIQIRRLIWYQIIFLDTRTADAVGPRAQIRRDEYDTKLPWNVDDEELDRTAQSGGQITGDSKHFTNMTITRMRVECYEMFRYTANESPKLFKKTDTGEKRVTVTSLLKKIQKFQRAVEQTYLPMFDKTIPLHAVAMELYGILTGRFYTKLLHSFASSTFNKRIMPERLRQILMSSCIMMLEHTMVIEQHPVLSPWGWYIGAIHQHQIALLLLVEMYVTTPDPSFATRAWRCLDYSFNLPASLPQTTKARMVLVELSDRTRKYLSIRRVRAPTNMPHVIATGDATSESQTARQGSEEQSNMQRDDGTLHTTYSGHTLGEVPFDQFQTQSYQGHGQPEQPYMPMGSISQTDWGQLAMGIGDGQAPPLVTSAPGTMDFGALVPPVPFPDAPSMSFLSNDGGFSGSSGTNSTGATNPGRSTSPMESTLSDIDWNEWDGLFGNAQMGPDHMVILPFSFPDMETSDLQWLDQHGSGLQ